MTNVTPILRGFLYITLLFVKLQNSKSCILFFALTAWTFLFAECGSSFASPVSYTISDFEFDFKTTKSFDKDVLKEAMVLPKTLDFNQDELERDRQRLKKFYFDNGFFDALVDTDVAYDNVNYEADIKFTIIENSRYTVREILIDGLGKVPENLKTQINTNRLIKPGDFYMKANTTNESNRILDILQDNGYLNARLDTTYRTEIAKYSREVQKNPDFNNKVRVKLTFAGADKIYYFGKTSVNIADNKYKIDTDIVLREMKFKEGDVYSKELLVESEQNLTKLAIVQLGRIQIDTVIESSRKVYHVVNISLNTKYQVTPSIVGKQIDNYFYFGGGLQYDDKNFFGGGRVFSVDLEPLYHNKDINEVSLTTSLFQPYLFRDNVTGNVSLTTLFKNFSVIKQYFIISNSITLNYQTRPWVFYKTLSAYLTTDLVRTKYKQADDEPDNNIHIKQDSIQNLLNAVVGFNATHDNTNNVFNPSGGFYHSFTIEDAGLIPFLLNKFKNNIDYSQYLKIYLVNYFYFDISGGIASKIFAMSNRIGDIMEYGNNPNLVPIQSQYKFFSGGGNSVRGWRAQDNGILDNKLNGGKFLFEGSFELRWMNFNSNTNFMKNFGTVYFLDYGNVWETHKQFQLREISLAIGFGVRYYTFVGPVRIDVGFRLYDPGGNDGKKWLFQNSFRDIFVKPLYAIQFGLGNAF